MRGTRRARNLAALATAAVLALTATGVAGASTGWTVQPVPSTGNVAWLTSVSCASAEACVGVGVGIGHKTRLVYGWDGTSWTRRSVPKPSASHAGFMAVSCYNANRCVAVGDENSPHGYQPFAERMTGRTWAIVPVPPVAGTDQAEPYAISCPEEAWCTAVGEDQTPSALAENWNGTTWATQATPAIGSYVTELNGISCTSASFCVAVGAEIESAAGPLAAVTEIWNGTDWTAEPVPPPLSTAYQSDLAGASCSSPDACTAVGYYEVNGKMQPAALRWNGTAWAYQRFPAGTTVLWVSCPAVASCTAAGENTVSGINSPQIFHWNGAVWMRTSTPKPAGESNGYLDGISCPRAGFCMAVGGYGAPGTPPTTPLSEDD
jgi:hypothetical protein